MEQDPAFAFRVVVDIAAKGLSPRSTIRHAVLAIDRIHHHAATTSAIVVLMMNMSRT